MSFMRLIVVAVALVSPLAAASTVTYYHNDLLGSPVVATDSSGHVVWRESYRPYGERLTNSASALDNRIWFTSRRQDPETGLVYMGARYYDPVTGRFVSTDPKLFDEGNLHSFNRYAYANDNPYRYADPNGNSAIDVPFAFWDGGKFVGAVAAWTVGTVTGDGALAKVGAEGVEETRWNAAFGVAGIVLPASASTIEHGAEATSAVERVIAETLGAKGNITSATKLSADELLQAGERFLGTGYKEVGKNGSGVFRSADGTRQFRIDNGSLMGKHGPGPHGHLEVFKPGAAKPTTINHIPFQD